MVTFVRDPRDRNGKGQNRVPAIETNAEKTLDKLGQWIGKHPEWATASAVVIGAVIGWWIKRK